MIDVTSYQKNITEFPVRKIENVFLPTSIQDLKEVVLWANENKIQISPISTGHNWGLGSKLPVNDAAIIDLHKLDKVLDVNVELAYARVQPGVTQKQLYDYLEEHAPSLMLNVTGSDAHSSIIGNMMERGSGKNGHRADDLRELKVLLANGDEISTGFGSMRSKGNLSYYKYGLGPDLTHLFTQSNFGIITEAVINLIPKQPFSLHLIKIDKEQLGTFIATYAEQNKKDIVNCSLEIDSHNDPKIHELFSKREDIRQESWYAWFVIYGEKPLRTIKTETLLHALQKCSVEVKEYHSEEDQSGELLPVTARMKRYSGEPCDETLLSWANAFGIKMTPNDVDIDKYKSVPGFRCVLPVVPFTKDAAMVINKIKDFTIDWGLDPVFSIIALNKYSLEVFVRVHFDRNNQEEITKASQWAKALLSKLREFDIFPYRLDIENMESYLKMHDYPELKFISDLKNVFDHHHILSKGRYVV